ncbi:sensor histidine kinase [Paenibacillus mucilaginosus]|uniref:sensor histidine kinase n=1 Tax=Paenibacillus mucilaginosus TaxID=61624 RepID=UPI003D227B0A
MDLGNWLAPLFVFLVTMTLLRKLFAMMESLQEELQKEKASKAALEERERIAQELHDGIAQSLFLLSVRIDRMEKSGPRELQASMADSYQSLRKTVHEINDYVRQAIGSLRYPSTEDSKPWMESIHHLVDDCVRDTRIFVHLDWGLSDNRLSIQEKVGLYSTIREAIINVCKHAEARNIWIQGGDLERGGWVCEIKDDGIGLPDAYQEKAASGFGIRISKERARKLDWRFDVRRECDTTIVRIQKEANT